MLLSRDTLEVGSECLRVAIDPAHGAEIIGLDHVRAGSLLWTAAPAGPPQGGDLDEPRWTHQYGGGWQVLFPNAGEVSGAHGFHGAASASPWELRSADGATARLAWHGHGLRIVRTLRVRGNVVDVVDEVHNQESVPASYLIGHHPTFGGDLLESGSCRIDAPGWPLAELDHAGRSGVWPHLGGTDWSHVDPDRPGMRFGRLSVTGKRAKISLRSEATGFGVELAWSARDFPWCWLWTDVDGLDAPPWRGSARLVAIEPVTAPHHHGLARVAAEGAACALAPRATRRHRLTVTVLEGAA